MKKICIIIPYYGKFPNYFDLWIQSVAYNEDVNFLIVTDIDGEFEFPKNVEVLHMNFEELKKLISCKLEMDVVIKKPYKLCDYRIAYGKIFEDYLKEYHFWGFCDVDLIFGNIRKFITEDILEKYDKINFRGHFSLFRNNKILKDLFKEENQFLNYKDAFKTNYACHFDEHKGWLEVYREKEISYYCVYSYADISCGKYRFCLVQDEENFYNTENKQIYLWDKGKLERYYLNEGEVVSDEWMYIHLQKRSMKKKNIGNPERYIICPNEFLTGRNITADLISRYSKEKIYWEYKKRRLKDIITQVKNGALKMRIIMWREKRNLNIRSR